MFYFTLHKKNNQQIKINIRGMQKAHEQSSLQNFVHGLKAPCPSDGL
jgi:hypothetical protein